MQSVAIDPISQLIIRKNIMFKTPKNLWSSLCCGRVSWRIRLTAGQIVPFAVSARSLAQCGASYWVDLCGQIKTGGAVSMWNVDLTVKEDGLRQ